MSRATAARRRLARRPLHARQRDAAAADLDFAALGASGPLAEQLQGFSWLRDLAAAASREKGARLAEALVGRWLLAHGTRVDEAWAPICGASASSSGPPTRPTSCRAATRLSLGLAQHAGARRAPSRFHRRQGAAGAERITAWCGVVAAGLLVQGGVPRVARGEAGLARALATAQFDDGGLISRSPFEQMLLVDRLGLLRACYFAAKQTLPDGIEAPRRRRWRRFMASPWATARCRAGRAAIPASRRGWRR
jgi:uncharacterized heparinase superfamily protein